MSQELAGIALGIRRCQGCILWEGAAKAVPGEGPVPAKWMIVGEAPGKEEDKTGRPFVGQAGRRLEALLRLAGLARDEVYITNVVKHRPPKNRKPKVVEVKACRPWLEQQLALVEPLTVLALGEPATVWFLGRGYSLGKEHGVGRVVKREGWTGVVVPLYHPAAVFRKPELWAVMVKDWAGLRELKLSSPFVEAIAPVYGLVSDGQALMTVLGQCYHGRGEVT